ncbi:MAG: hypothetical protein V7K41_29180, partial [Nostoc sp.]|uniref:hypothetical protein n=1 Tax=Nostoc sp. TaxID=1180 RepID=UPI002FF9E955
VGFRHMYSDRAPSKRKETISSLCPNRLGGCYITLKAATDISTANLFTNGSGKVSIFLDENANLENQNSGDVTTGSINANQLAILSSGGVNNKGDINTLGGVIIAADGDVTTHSIKTRHGIVGLFSNQGAVTTQGNIIASSYTIAPLESLVGSYDLGNIQIIALGIDKDKSLSNLVTKNFDALIESNIKGTLEASNPPGIGPGPFNPPGNQPIPYYLGIEAHNDIAAFYKDQHRNDKVFVNYYPISTILNTFQERGEKPNINALSEKKQQKKLDILNVDKHDLYEIKSQNQQSLALPVATGYAALFKKAGITINLGSSIEPGTFGVIPAPGGYYTFASPQAGTIIYKYNRGTFSNIPENQTQQKSNPADPITIISEITGLTGAALFAYLIVSEALRILVPPRNFIPLP